MVVPCVQVPEWRRGAEEANINPFKMMEMVGEGGWRRARKA